VVFVRLRVSVELDMMQLSPPQVIVEETDVVEEGEIVGVIEPTGPLEEFGMVVVPPVVCDCDVRDATPMAPTMMTTTATIAMIALPTAVRPDSVVVIEESMRFECLRDI
jgi:hypothetical protein